MATDPSKCATLYNATTYLAYSVNMLAMTPRPPFAVKDQLALFAASSNVADAAGHLRGQDPKIVAESAVEQGSLSVRKAQVMIETISLDIANTSTAASILAAINTAANDVRMI